MSPRTVQLRIGGDDVHAVVEIPLEGRAPLSALLANSFAKGRNTGRDEALESARNDAAALLVQAARRFDSRAETLADDAARCAMELGLVVAQTLVQKKITDGEHDIQGIVRSVLASAGGDRGPCVVHVHPVDAAALASVEFRAGTRIEPDAGVRRGDIRVETPMGLMVREVDETLKNLAARLREELR